MSSPFSLKMNTSDDVEVTHAKQETMEGGVVVLLRTSSVARAPVYAHLRQLGLELVVVHPFSPAAEFAGLFNWWLPHDTHDACALEPVLRQFLTAYALTDRLAAIVSFDEYAVYPAALLAVRWSLQPVPLPPEQLRHVNIKSDFRLWCHAHGVNAPRHVVLHNVPVLDPDDGTADVDSARAALRACVASQLCDLAFPVILKPSPGAGSLLAKVCQTVEEAAAHAEAMSRALRGHPDERHFAALRRSYAEQGWSSASSSSVSAPGVAPSTEERRDVAPGPAPATTTTTTAAAAVEILAEEYVGGHEVDMDCAVEHGRLVFCAISDNFDTKPPFCAEEGGTCPSSLPDTAQIALRDLLESFLAAHGSAVHGVLHFEAKYDPVRATAYVIEVNCRMGSAETHSMLHTAYRGLQLGEALVRCAMGRPLRPWIARYYPEQWPTECACAPCDSTLCVLDTVPPLGAEAEDDTRERSEAWMDRQGLSASSTSSTPQHEAWLGASVAVEASTQIAHTPPSTLLSVPAAAPWQGDRDCAGPSDLVVLHAPTTTPTATATAITAVARVCDAPGSSDTSDVLDGVLACSRLGGPARGFYPAGAVAASVNIYPESTGILVRVSAPWADPRLVACSVSAVPGDHVAPPPGRFYLLCWMVARGRSVAEAVENIQALTAAFEQHVELDPKY